MYKKNVARITGPLCGTVTLYCSALFVHRYCFDERLNDPTHYPLQRMQSMTKSVGDKFLKTTYVASVQLLSLQQRKVNEDPFPVIA